MRSKPGSAKTSKTARNALRMPRQCKEPRCVRGYHKRGPHKNQVGEVFDTVTAGVSRDAESGR